MSKPVIGLSWEPKLPNLSAGSGSNTKAKDKQSECNILGKLSSDLIDGLYVSSNDPRKLNKLLKKQVKDTTGTSWFDMPAPTITPEMKKDLELLKLRHVIDPKRHYKKGDSKTLPKYFQVGTVIESPLEFFSGRLSKKERKQTLADEILSDRNLENYRKRKVREIREALEPGGNKKWKNDGKKTLKRAKHRRM